MGNHQRKASSVIYLLDNLRLPKPCVVSCAKTLQRLDPKKRVLSLVLPWLTWKLMMWNLLRTGL